MKPPRVLHEASLRPQPRCKGPGKRGELGGGRTRVRPRHDPVSPAAAHPDGAVAAASFSPLAPRLPPSACYFGMGPPQHRPGGAGAPRGALQHQREGAGGSQRTLLGCRGGDVAVPGAPLSPAMAQHGQGGTERLGGPLQDQSQRCQMSFPNVSTAGKRGAGAGFWGAAAPEGWRCRPGGALASILWPPLQDGLCLPSTSERVQHGLSSVLRFVSL